LHQWLDCNIRTPNIDTTHDNWQTFFGVYIYQLSKDKNGFVINRKLVIDNQFLRLITNKASFDIFSFKRSVESQSHSMRRSIEIFWTPPPHDYCKMENANLCPYDTR